MWSDELAIRVSNYDSMIHAAEIAKAHILWLHKLLKFEYLFLNAD